MNKNDVAILIPIYRDFLDSYEIISLNSIIRNFNNYKIIFISPDEMSMDSYQLFFNQLNNFEIMYFEKDCFDSIDRYNKLLLDFKFYEKFSDFEYILICQLDVYVFKDELLNWINKKYDYIGSPWIGSKRNYLNISLEYLNNFFRKLTCKKLKNIERLFKVGNGGFSLRKVDKFIDISKNETKKIEDFFNKKDSTDYYIEDVFWSLYVPKKYKDYDIPNWQEALSFSIDRKPKLSFKLNNYNLPMACHRFNYKKSFDFWKKYIK